MSIPRDPSTPDSTTVIHHVYRHRGDLLPACKAIPGPDYVYTSDGQRSVTVQFWHTGHDPVSLLAHAGLGHGCCTTCLTLAREMTGEVIAPAEENNKLIFNDDLACLDDDQGPYGQSDDDGLPPVFHGVGECTQIVEPEDIDDPRNGWF